MNRPAPSLLGSTKSPASSTSEQHPKPRLLFFRKSRAGLPLFIKLHLAQHLKCLSLFFDVTLVESDCDYDQVCSEYEPDLSLFKSSIYGASHLISNTHTHAVVPKLAFFNADPYCSSRAILLQSIDQWGISDVFTLSTRLQDFLPTANLRIFFWPNFIDPDLHYDYGASKEIPILFHRESGVALSLAQSSS